MGWIEDYSSGSIQWQNEEEGKTTPITAEVLQRYENTIAELCQEVKTLRDSVSQLDHDTGWINLWESDTTHCHARRIGGIVYVRCDVWGGTRPGSDWTDFTRLPNDMLPARTCYFAGSALSGDATVNVRISESGLISVICEGRSVSYWTFSAAFPVG